MAQLLPEPAVELVAPDSTALKTWRLEAESIHLLQ
jgi:hypothetical protein